jgi:hypothetical protein
MRRTDDGDIILTESQYYYLIDSAMRLDAVIESMPMDFSDLYPDWPEGYEDYDLGWEVPEDA